MGAAPKTGGYQLSVLKAHINILGQVGWRTREHILVTIATVHVNGILQNQPCCFSQNKLTVPFRRSNTSFSIVIIALMKFKFAVHVLG
jgi:hypothetical protein